MHDKVSKDAAGSEGSAALPMRSCKRPGACARAPRAAGSGAAESAANMYKSIGEKFGVS